METNILIAGLLGLGIALMVLWFALLGGAQLWKHTWNWIDDGDNPIKVNPMAAFIMARFAKCEYRPKHPGYDWHSWYDKQNDHVCEAPYIMLPGLGLIFAPTIIYLALKFYPVAIAASILVLMAHIARFARRHKKLFDRHIKDPLAHLSCKDGRAKQDDAAG